ncbi:MAG: dTMP kinase [Elusimicrobia bacterium]|nr:MAG: dTMP kinase [Elusimicrobiota bacterium]KAF0156449.1 MAG: dTMP kinase [Elusimicrobiota bacterium]
MRHGAPFGRGRAENPGKTGVFPFCYHIIMKRGIFIVLEGPDRSGKSTQAAMLRDWLTGLGRKVRLTREPGGTYLSEKIRAILLDPKSEIEPLTELFLYETSRAKHTLKVIMPALKAGEIIVSDRYTMSTTAYQGYGRGLDLKTVETLNRIATMGLKPDLTIVFDVPDSVFKRRECRGSDRMELQTASFRLKVNRAYKKLAARPGVVRVNAAAAIEAVHGQVRSAVNALLRKKGFRTR